MLLLIKLEILFRFYQFFYWCPFSVPASRSGATQHLVFSLGPQICDSSSGSPCFHELLVVLRNIGQVFCRHVLQFGFIWCVCPLRLRLWVRRFGGRIPQSWNVLLFTSRCRVHDGNMACPWSFIHNHLGRGWCLLGFSAGILLFPMPDSAVEVNDSPAPLLTGTRPELDLSG